MEARFSRRLIVDRLTPEATARRQKGMRFLVLRPLPALLAFFALGNLTAALIPGFRRARCVGRGVVLGAAAVYAWLVV